MKKLLATVVPLMLASHAFAQACWSEWERDGEWLMRAGNCTENVSIPDTDKLCRSRIKSDEPRRAASCPATAKVFHKGAVLVEPVEFRCMGLKPQAAGGSYNVFHYGLSKDAGQLDAMRKLCEQFGGKWVAGK